MEDKHQIKPEDMRHPTDELPPEREPARPRYETPQALRVTDQQVGAGQGCLNPGSAYTPG
jgi:hypothetical protein